MKTRAILAAGIAALLAPRALVAAPPAVVKAGNAQPALAVGFDAKGALRAAVCASPPQCSVEGGLDLKLPAELSGKAQQSSLSKVPIGNQRYAIAVSVPTGSPDTKWEAVVAAPIGGGQPVVLFSGYTGFAEGVEGERHGGMVVISAADDNNDRKILIGQQLENLTLCGRPAIQSPTVVDARTLKLVPVKVQRLDPEQRNAAVRVTAEAVTGPGNASLGVLRPKGASSSVGEVGAISDGKLETSWSENRGGSGKGEFVLFDMPADLPLHGVEIVFRPNGADVAHGAAPKELYIASTHRLFRVEVPADAWQTPGARYAVKFEPPLTDDCLALVLDTAGSDTPDTRVTVAEIVATTEFQNSDPAVLVGALAGGGLRARAAAAVLRTKGTPAYEAVAARFGELDEAGRLLALEIVDSAPCEISVPVYVQALQGTSEGQSVHAERLRRCGAIASSALSAALSSAKGKALEKVASELGLIAPADSIKALVKLLGDKDPGKRRTLRVALARASMSADAAPAVRASLADQTLPEGVLLELLRALGPQLPRFMPEASAALARISSPDAPFRVRYLRTLPAGALAAKDEGARRLLAGALANERDANVRAQAARAVPSPELFARELERALKDPEVRVREAAARALASPKSGFASASLSERLAADEWPMVRSAAALALAELGPAPAVDAGLGAALEDESWLVRRDVAFALGKRRALGQAEQLRARLSDGDERFEVRSAAARALGQVCDMGALSLLTGYVRKLADPLASNEERAIALASLSALTRLGPADLKDRLAPVLDKRAPAGSRATAQAALETRPACKR